MYRTLFAALVCASVAAAAEPARTRTLSDDMRRAIQWERHKEQAAARQARREARHPSVTYNNEAARSADRGAPDPGEPAVRKEKRNDQDR